MHLAYLDASSGSMIASAVAGTAAAAAVAVKVGWGRFAGAISRKGKSVDETVTDTDVDGTTAGEAPA